MLTISPAVEARAIEKLRQEELEEARAVQSLMLPAEVLMRRPATIAHEFQPVDIVRRRLRRLFLMDNGQRGILRLAMFPGKGLPPRCTPPWRWEFCVASHKTDQSPSEILSALNKRLMSRGGLRRHAAIVYGVFEPRTVGDALGQRRNARHRVYLSASGAQGSRIYQASLLACLPTRNTTR